MFLKTIKAFCLYPTDNPTLVGMQEQLSRRFQTYLEMYNSFALQIGEYDFSFRGKIVYEDRELQGSLPFLFFKDGMRELRFMEGIEEWEIRGLTDIIIQRDNINEFEDDLITLIWEKDFIHISYIATDQFLEETPVLIPETWYLVRNLVYILGRIGQETSMPYIQKSYSHSEPRVRREAVQAAGLIGGPRATTLLTRALKDQDLRIRSMAGINLARVGKKASLPALLEVIQAKDFSKRDPYEVKAFFEAVGSVGSNEAVRPLQQIPIEILNKPEKLTPEDWAVIRRHPVFGAETIMRIKEWGELSARMIYGAFDHHLKFDLSGYPKLSPL